MIYDYKTHIAKNGANVYFVAEGNESGAIEKTTITPANPLCQCYSVSKAYTALAVGICCDRGLLTPDAHVTDVLRKDFPLWYDKKWDNVTVDDLLRHRSGLTRGVLDIDVLDASEFDPDYLKIVASEPINGNTGTSFCYTDDVFYLLSRMVTEAAGTETSALLRKPLMENMRFKEYAWSVCPKGCAMGGTGLCLRTEDAVKLGVLYLNGGMWRGERIVSESWINRSIERLYGFDFCRDGILFKGGMRGQGLAIDFRKRIAVAYNGYGGYAPSDVIPDMRCFAAGQR